MIYTIYLYCDYVNVFTYESSIIPMEGDLYPDVNGQGYLVKSRTLLITQPTVINIHVTAL